MWKKKPPGLPGAVSIQLGKSGARVTPGPNMLQRFLAFDLLAADFTVATFCSTDFSTVS